jgi:WD40 repeat protein
MINQVEWKEDGSTFITATSVGLFSYDSFSLMLVDSYDVGENIQSLLIGKDNGLIALGGMNGDIKWIEPVTGQYLGSYEGHSLAITDMIYTGSGNLIISGSDDGTIRSWDPGFIKNPGQSGSPLQNVIRTNNRVTCLAVDPNEDFVAAGGYRSWALWELSSGEKVVEFSGFNSWINDIAFSTDGEFFAMADSSNIIRIWKTDGWILSYEVALAQVQIISSIDFVPDQNILVLGSVSGKIVEWELEADELFIIGDISPYAVTDVEHNFNGTSLLIGTIHGFLRLIKGRF